MKPPELQRLRSLATAFHGAIERADFRTGNLTRFPFECCHHACSLLGIFLHENGVTGITKISGRHSGSADGRHLWLEVNGTVIDITAYQFDEVEEKIIVEQSSDWRSTLAGKPLQLGVVEEDAESYFERVKAFYNETYGGLYERLAHIARNAG